MEYIVGVLLSIIGLLLWKNERLRDNLWNDAVDAAKEQLRKVGVENEQAEAEAQAQREKARDEVEAVPEPTPVTDLDDAINRYRGRISSGDSN